MNMRGRMIVCVLAVVGLSLTAVAEEQGRTILATGGFWRAFGACRPEQVDPQFTGSLKPVTGDGVRTTSPSADWMQPSFDDTAWFRSPGPFGGLPRNCGTLLLRGRFAVSDPAAVTKLLLSAKYRGGMVVYLNGKEVLRRDMPKGQVAIETAALTYPAEVYVDDKGKLIPRRFKKNSDMATRVKQRNRCFEAAEIATQFLRKGVNVLAVALHRSDVRSEAAKWKPRRDRSEAWAHLLLGRIRLSAVAAKGAVTANVSRPAGVQIFNQDIHRIFSLTEYGDPNEPLRPIRLVCVRNGYASGQVVVSSTDSLKGLAAVAGDLTGPGGAKIPASAVRIRYATQSKMRISASGSGLAYAKYTRIPAFVALMDRAPDMIKPVALRTNAKSRSPLSLPAKMVPAAMTGVWVTVRVPRDCPAGVYAGSVTITATGLRRDVAVEVDVIDWTLPDEKDFVTYMAASQSPDTLAAQYKVPLWSPKHWQLMDRSWRLQGLIGNNVLVVPLVCRTQYGNDESYVPITQRGGGGYTYDFGTYDRLVALAKKHCDIRVIAYQVYTATGWKGPGPEKEMFITAVDSATGKRERMKLPSYDCDRSTKLWKPMFDQLKEHNRKLGLDGRITFVLGIGQDGGIHKDVRKHFEAMWPGIKWQYGAHGREPRFYNIRRGHKTIYGYSEYLYVPRLPVLSKGRMYGWKLNAIPTMMSQRIGGKLQSPMVTRTIAERAMVRGDSGAGRMCLDYWDMPDVRRGSHFGTMYSRWPNSSADQRTPQLKMLTYPGPDGAVPSTKLLVMREGLQETEARIVLEKAIDAGKIDGDLAKRAQTLLDRRYEMLRAIDYLRHTVRTTFGDGWRREAAKLYKMAGEVERAVKSK